MAEADTNAVALAFRVVVDQGRFDLGYFTACDGLGCEITVEQREEGGTPGFIHQLPGRIKYSNVKLTRILNKDTGKITGWFTELTKTGFSRTTAQISALTAEGTEVASWKLEGVIPVKWTGPSLNVETSKVATETLELAHHGFLPG
ncbi:MAG: hypothetical protein JWL70_2317 [Acidimicrobiia bacterium]|nr:hypothetical protein [Acidimicrobiia bacterium]